jgi:hypothetical protein
MRQRERWERAVGISIIAVIASGILTVAAHDGFFRVRCSLPMSTACISNLKMLEGAKGTWALEKAVGSNAVPTDADLFGVDLYIREKPVCPAEGTYTLGAVHQKPRCSIRGHTI